MTSQKTTSASESVIQLASFWPYQVTVLADRIARRTSVLVKAEGLNLSQWRVLAAIAELPGRSSVDVVTITPMDKGIVSRATKALLEHGFIRREASQLDGRMSHLYLTTAGHELYHRLMPQVSAVLQLAGKTLSEDAQNRLISDLHQLIEALPDPR